MSAPFAVISAPVPASVVAAQRDRLWDDCRNSLGIARLLVHEDRPASFVETACRSALESACRAALEQAGLRYEGDVERGLARLAAPRDLWSDVPARPAELLAAAERAVAWLAAYMRSEAPGRSWGY